MSLSQYQKKDSAMASNKLAVANGEPQETFSSLAPAQRNKKRKSHHGKMKYIAKKMAVLERDKQQAAAERREVRHFFVRVIPLLQRHEAKYTKEIKKTNAHPVHCVWLPSLVRDCLWFCFLSLSLSLSLFLSSFRCLL
jgi:hypothetical protein